MSALALLPLPTHGLAKPGGFTEQKHLSLRPAFWHDSLIDFMLAHPDATLADLAAYCGRTPAWISTIRGSDSFRARYEQRRNALSEELASGIHRKLQSVVGTALDILDVKLKDVKATGVGMSVSEVVSTTDSLLAKLGYGVKEKGGVTVNVQQNSVPVVSPVDPAAFHEARAELRAKEAQRLAAPVSNGPLSGPVVDIVEGDS